MAKPTKLEESLPLVAPDLQEQLVKWDRYLTSERNLSPHTRRAYHTDISHFISFMSQHLGKNPSIGDLSDIKIQDFRGWLSRKAGEGVSSRSRARSLSAIKNFMRWLDKRGIAHNASLSIIQTPKIPRTLPKALTENQAKELLSIERFKQAQSWIDRRDHALFVLLYGCGLRIAEALNLNIGDIPTDRFFKIIGKGGRERMVPVLPVVLEMLENYVETRPFSNNPDDSIFVGIRGKRLNQGMAQKALRDIRVSFGLPETLTPHALRHSFATHLLSNGANLREIQELLGHASLASTQIYTDVDTAQMLKVFKKAHPRSK